MNAKNAWRATVIRWLKFNAVGGTGIVVQLVVLALLKSGLKLNYLMATALAVEAAVINNFLWHERFTWVDRPSQNACWRFFKFNLTNGTLSIAGNLLLMKLTVGMWHLHYLLANILTITACSVANFFVSDRLVFQSCPAAHKVRASSTQLGKQVF
jgi:dolichol-phosphate mannosyltransferase